MVIMYSLQILHYPFPYPGNCLLSDVYPFT
jgi:hypothetical protein